MIYDLIVVGNGLAAQTFLFELFIKLDVKKSQNFSVAQIYSEVIAPACSLRSTATVSLSGIEEGVSELGDELRESFFLFEEFQKKHLPNGVERIKQCLTFSSPIEKEKLMRRYKELNKINHSVFNDQIEGIELDSYLISPELYNEWFNQELSNKKIVKKKNFLINMIINSDGIIECELQSREILKTQKIVFCTGAYAKLFSKFFNSTDGLTNTQTVAGSFLEKSIDLKCSSFFVTIDGHHLIYRSLEQKLVLGSASMSGGIIMANGDALRDRLNLFNQKCNFPIGQFTDFKIITGLRHKGPKRRPIAKALDSNKSIYMINGLYKNGYTFSHLCAKNILREISL